MTIVIGDELSEEERIFQRPGPESFPAVEICLDIRELQLFNERNIIKLLVESTLHKTRHLKIFF